jgi:fructokinase
MGKLIGIGEALIDMIPTQTNKPIKEVASFSPIVGGAPANVCGAFSKLSGKTQMITQLGDDPFGDKVIDTLKKFSIGYDYIQRTNKANTGLAFVALSDDGGREFSFYRRPSADMLMEKSQIKEEWFEDAFALHFCSVCLGDFPMKETHKQAIEYARNKGALISFDPNLRFNLWESEEALKEAVLEFIPYADILKVSDEELSFITGIEDEEAAIKSLFRGSVEMIVYTKGSKGAYVYTKNATAYAESMKVKAVDTTGAGDAFIGSFLYCLETWMRENDIVLSDISSNEDLFSRLTEEKLEQMLIFSNRYCGKSVMHNGAIESYPTLEEMEE